MFELKETAGYILLIFVILAIAYPLGRISIKNISLGSAAVFLIAILFGHFGFSLPPIIETIGLICFVTSVGFMAGPTFFHNIKKNIKSYVLLALVIILTGALSCVAIIKITNITSPMAVGILTGSLTTTPGFAAAKEVVSASPDAITELTVGHAIAYPFGVIGVVLFVQLMPRILGININEERRKMQQDIVRSNKEYSGKLIKMDPVGLFPLSLAVLCGILVGSVSIPLPGGASFSLGTTGGPLIAGLIMGHFYHIGPIDFRTDKKMLETLRELGLVLFLIGSGLSGGSDFIATLSEYGVILFLYGAVMTILPMLAGYLVAVKLLKLPLLNSLGSITGGMTSTPALGTLIQVAGTDDVASAYAATYPIALLTVVLASQMIVVII